MANVLYVCNDNQIIAMDITNNLAIIQKLDVMGDLMSVSCRNTNSANIMQTIASGSNASQNVVDQGYGIYKNMLSVLVPDGMTSSWTIVGPGISFHNPFVSIAFEPSSQILTLLHMDGSIQSAPAADPLNNLSTPTKMSAIDIKYYKQILYYIDFNNLLHGPSGNLGGPYTRFDIDTNGIVYGVIGSSIYIITSGGVTSLLKQTNNPGLITSFAICKSTGNAYILANNRIYVAFGGINAGNDIVWTDIDIGNTVCIAF